MDAVVAAALLGAAIFDRLDWARLAQWREDQATNLWLGFTHGLLDLPVGLISSVGTPNPNGMPLLGIPLSRLPGLLSVSWTLGAIQATLVVALCFSLTLERSARMALALALLSAVLLRASSVEFWNNWILTSVNLAFTASVIRYLRRPSWAWLPAWSLLVLLGPSVYLAGLVNGLVFAAAAVALLRFHPPASSPHVRTAAVAASLLLVIVSGWVTWAPFLREVGIAGIATATSVDLPTRALGGATSLVGSPLWWPFTWVASSSFVILQSSREILSPVALQALEVAGALLAAQCATALTAFVIFAWQGRTVHLANPGTVPPRAGLGLREPAWIGGMVAAAYVVSPLLGGPAWAHGERMEMAVQWFPMLFVAWFTGGLAFPLPPRAHRLVRATTLVVALLFSVTNVVLGEAVRDSYSSYRGSVLIPADVPLADKVAAVDFIAMDWRRRGGGVAVPVDYDLGGGAWDWVPVFGAGLTRWYPAPMTLGRAFDYELLRRHGLANDQEGRIRVPPGTGQYVVGYLGFPPLLTPGRSFREVPIGRLRVSVADP